MTAWTKLNKLLAGKVAVIIGGGPSVSSQLVWSDVAGLPVIGCNDAFQLPGVHICVWGDTRWFVAWKDRLAPWPGLKVTCNKKQKASGADIIVLPRSYKKIDPGCLAYYGNVGATAIHLAAAAGAVGALLFGFDMKSEKGRHHWHDQELSKASSNVYFLFQRQFTAFARDLRKAYPKFRAINTNLGSALKVFPKMALADARKVFQC